VSDVVKYGVTPAVNFSVNVSEEGGVSPALEYFEFVSHTLSLAAVFMSAPTIGGRPSVRPSVLCLLTQHLFRVTRYLSDISGDFN